MNDMANVAPLLFTVTLNTEQVDTQLFGTVTVSELPSRLLARLYEENDPESKGESFGHALLCETVTGPNGERFTPAILESLPNRALADLKLLMQAAVRVNGVSTEEVGKD